MLFSDLNNKIAGANKNWQKIRKSMGGGKATDKFLKGAYLVITNEHLQIDIAGLDTNLREIVLKKPGLLKGTAQNKAFILLCRKLKELEERSKQRISHEMFKNTLVQLQKTRSDYNSFDVSALDFADDLNIEIRFPYLNMDIIQKIKQHPLVDSEKTCLCMACIRVVLK